MQHVFRPGDRVRVVTTGLVERVEAQTPTPSPPIILLAGDERSYAPEDLEYLSEDGDRPLPRMCPFCGAAPVASDVPGAFAEMGECDGKSHQVKASLVGYRCPNGHGFYVWPDGKAVAGLPRYASEEPEVVAKGVREGTEAGVSMPVLQMKPVFDSPYEQYRDRNGQVFVLVREITEPDDSHDAEVLPVYVIRFPDGVEIEAWPEEILQEA